MSTGEKEDLVIKVPEDHESFAVALGEAAKGDSSEGAVLISKISLEEINIEGVTSVTDTPPTEPSEGLQKQLKLQAIEILKKLKEFSDPPDADALLDNPSLQSYRNARREIYERVSKTPLAAEDISVAQLILEQIPALLETVRVTISKRLNGEKDTILNDSCMREDLDEASKFAPDAHQRILSARQAVETKAGLMTAVALNEARELLRSVRNSLNDARVVVLQVKAQRILQEVKKFVDPNGADPIEDKDSLKDIRDARRIIHESLSKPTLSTQDVHNAQNLLEKLPALLNTAKNKIEARLSVERNKILDDSCMKQTVEFGKEFAVEALQRVEAKREAVRNAAERLTSQSLAEARDLLRHVRTALNDADAVVQMHVQELLKKAAEPVLKDVTDVELLGKNPDGVLPKLEKSLNAKRDEAKKLLETTPLTDAIVKQGAEARDALRELLGKAEEEILALGGKGEIEKFQDAVGGQAQLEKLQDSFGANDPTKLMSLVADFGGFETLKKLATYKSNFTDLKKVCDTLGGPKCVSSLLVDVCEGKPDKLDSIDKAFDGDFTKLGVLLKAGGLEKHPKALASLFKTGCKGAPGELKKLCDGFGEKEDLENLSSLLEKGGLGAKPECFGQLVAIGCSDPTYGAASKLKAFSREVKNQLPQLQSLLGVKTNGEVDPAAEGGLADNPEVFAHLFAAGCDKNSKKFKTFLTTFDATGVQQLNKLVKEGGFAKHQVEEPPGSGTKVDAVDPAALGKFLAMGCGGKPGDFKTVCATLSASPDGLKGLKNLMQLGGLGAKPDCLGQMLALGVKDDAGIGATATKFDAILKTLDNPSLLSKMQGLVGVKPNGLTDSTLAGGLGDNGEVFGHLIGTGCEKDPAKLKSLLEKFDVKGLADLNKLVKDGGFASHKIESGKAVRKQVEYPPGTMVNAVDPKCLGKLLETGCDKDPTKLKDLCKALTSDQRTHLQGCMETGRLGEDPEVIGYLYQIGCDKTPTDMQAFCNVFNSSDKQKKLGNLMKKGGFNGKPNAKKPATLGKVLKDAFKVGTKPHPEKLLNLHDAFSGDTNLAKMERMFNAYNTPPVPGVKADDPGKKLKRVMKALNIQNPGDFAKLRTTYYDKLNSAPTDSNLKPDGSSYSYSAGPPIVDEFLDALLANSATLDLSPVGLHYPPPGGSQYDGNVRDCHFLNRHGRPFQDLSSHLTQNNPVSFWPEGFDKTAIMNEFTAVKNYTTSAVTLKRPNGSNFDKSAYVKTPGTGTTPTVYFGAGDPINRALMDAAGEAYLQFVVTQSGRELLIGIKRTGPGVEYDQFYPRKGPDIVKFKYETMSEFMTLALGK